MTTSRVTHHSAPKVYPPSAPSCYETCLECAAAYVGTARARFAGEWLPSIESSHVGPPARWWLWRYGGRLWVVRAECIGVSFMGPPVRLMLRSALPPSGDGGVKHHAVFAARLSGEGVMTLRGVRLFVPRHKVLGGSA